MRLNAKLTAIIMFFLASICIICMSGCKGKNEGSLESANVINVTVGEYYLNGDKSNRCIDVKDDHTLQFTNCDTDAWVDEIMEPSKDDYLDKNDYDQIVKEMKEILSKPIEYKDVDYRTNTENEIYIVLSETDGTRAMMCFKYISDSQGMSLVFGQNENIQEYILSE